MFNNNQCKAKQIKNKGLGSVSALKKIKSQDSLRATYNRNSKYQVQSNSKAKGLAPKQQFQMGSKSKQKNKYTKNIHQQYYMQQRFQQKNKKTNDVKQVIKAQTSRYIDDAQSQKRKKQTNNKKSQKNSEISKLSKFNFPQPRGVITFDGKVIKVAPNHAQSKTQHNYTSLSSSEYAINERQFTNIDGKNKLKSKSKSKKFKKQSSKSKSNYKSNTNRNCKSQQHIGSEKAMWNGLQYQFKKAHLLIEQTQISPIRKQYKQYQRLQKFDFEQIYELIDQDLRNCNQIKINQSIAKYRRQCIKMMSQISGAIPLRRETFYLAISIFDRAVTKKINTSNFILLGLVSTTLAMKLQQSQLSIQFVYVLGIINKSKQSHFSSTCSKQSSKHKSIQKSQKSADKNPTKSKKIQIKQKHVRKIRTSAIQKILKSYNCGKIQKTEFMQLEERVTLYLRFRLWRIQAIYWADLLTCIWDQHLLSIQLQNNNVLLFRNPSYLAKLSHLYQLLQMAYMNQAVYKYPSIYIVLAAMYLLARIAKQKQTQKGQQNGYEMYRTLLSNSTNILFVDKTGINQLFWSFLHKLRLQMVEILSCCQFISKFLYPNLMKSEINHQQSRDSPDLGLFIHQHNSDLYQNIIL